MAAAPASWRAKALWVLSQNGDAPTIRGFLSLSPRYSVERFMGR